MRSQQYTPSPLLVVLALTSVLSAASLVSASPASGDDFLGGILRRDGHGHHNPHSAPLLELNETEVTMYHAPTPPSYYTFDWESPSETNRHPGLIMTHIVFMCMAFFIALPIGIAMRSVKHSLHWVAVVAFYALCAFGCASSALYSKLTPNMYEGSVHGTHGYMVLLLAISLTTIDALSVFRRIIAFVRSGESFSIKTFWRSTLLGRTLDRQDLGPEYIELVVGELEEFEDAKVNLSPIRGSTDIDPMQQDFEHGDTAQWANNVHHHHHHHHHHQHRRQQSMASDGTVFGTPSSIRSVDKIQEVKGAPSLKVGLFRRMGSAAFATAERALVFGGLSQLLTGIVVYTGGCRENYTNGCLAHLIKGGIFWSYGLLSFARFLGSFAELGWAWNRAPTSGIVSAEFTESFVIFFYGATNTWMERFGANPGDPFTTKQIQHIGIAVMFCFAGLVGMGIESKRVRKWLAASTFASLQSTRVAQDAVAEPPSYVASFNPFPALVIGVTGAAMAAHAQTYLFQVQIHALWGNLLLAFSVLRCLTYFFLWLGPPRSILPSRPPTEVLGSFFLACGGLVFMFSTEEVTIAAMRRGRDDVMMFLNVAVAITCFAFCWTLFVVGFKGWLKSRLHPLVTYHSSA